MEKIYDVMSVFDNGEIWPHGTTVFPEILTREASQMVKKCWKYQGKNFEIAMIGDGAYSIIDILPDTTGFITMTQYDVSEAIILNGDGSIRFVLKPVINVRGFDQQRLAVIEKLEIERAFRAGKVISSYDPLAIFHYKTQRKDVLGFFGDDGFGDCHYCYDSNSGKLISAISHPRRS